MTRPAAPKCQGQEAGAVSTPCDAMGNESLRQRFPDRGCPHPQYVGLLVDAVRRSHWEAPQPVQLRRRFQETNRYNLLHAPSVASSA